MGLSFGDTVSRRNSKAPADQGGWSAGVGNPQPMDWLNPIGHQALADTGIGWYASWNHAGDADRVAGSEFAPGTTRSANTSSRPPSAAASPAC